MPKRNETLKFSTSFQGSVRASAQTTIVDMSYPTTYNSKWSSNQNGTDTITSIDEGKDAYFIITTDNVTDGTKVNVLLTSGTATNGINSADITNYKYSQSVTINNNSAFVKVSIAADNLTEGTEAFYGAVMSTSGTNLTYTWLNINDTSKTPEPTYKAGWYSTISGTTGIGSINEGSTAWFIINGTNVPNGTVLTVSLTGAGIDGNDFTDGLITKTVTMQNNVGRVNISIANDFTTEGNEILYGRVYNNGNQVDAASIVINDTSKTAIREVYWSTTANGLNRVNDYVWGSEMFLIVTSDNTSGSVSLNFNGTLKQSELIVGSLSPVTIQLSYNSALGVGMGVYRMQTMEEDNVAFSKNVWRNRTSVRSANTDYYNNTDEVIRIKIIIYHAEKGDAFSALYVDDLPYSQAGGRMSNGTLYYRYTLKATVRPGGKYRLNSQFVIESWRELAP